MSVIKGYAMQKWIEMYKLRGGFAIACPPPPIAEFARLPQVLTRRNQGMQEWVDTLGSQQRDRRSNDATF